MIHNFEQQLRVERRRIVRLLLEILGENLAMNHGCFLEDIGCSGEDDPLPEIRSLRERLHGAKDWTGGRLERGEVWEQPPTQPQREAQAENERA